MRQKKIVTRSKKYWTIRKHFVLIAVQNSHIPSSFLNDEKSFDLLNKIIANIGHAISNQADMDLVYENFVNLLQHDMDDKLKQRCTNTNTSTKSTYQELNHSCQYTYKSFGPNYVAV